MKPSRYNLFFPYEDKQIGYNSLSNQFIILDPFLHSLLDAAIQENSVDQIQAVHPDFYQFLRTKKFIVDNMLDELQIAKDIQQRTDNDDSYFHLTINPTMNCNFKCWYCYESHIKNSKMTAPTIDKILKLADTLIAEGKITYFHLSWFGGEPLLYYTDVIKPVIAELHARFQANNIRFDSNFTTNGLLITPELIDFCSLHHATYFQITLDGNEERHDKVRYISQEKGSYRAIVDNIFALARCKFTVTIRINISPETIEGLPDIARDFTQLEAEYHTHIEFSFQQVWQETADLDAQISQHIQHFRQLGFKVNYIGGRADTLRNSCYADKRNQATVNYNGDVFKCTARDFSSDTKEGILTDTGTLIWNERQEKRLNSKFKNKPCLECRIMPICNGGCSQNALENEGTDYCVYDFDEEKKKNVVYHKFLENVVHA